jgi:RNA-directed DNA polymerase
LAKRLQTPESIRKLQRKLYLKAKAEPNCRFHQLYDKVWRDDILFHAWELALFNGGAPGVDGVTFDQIDAEGLEDWLMALQKELREKTYRPMPVRRVSIPKPGGGERPLGIPTIRDRVVQAAAKLVIEPIFEADFDDSAFGYRPRRSAGDAIRKVHGLLCQGFTEVVDADLSRYFDTIPHGPLMQSVARRIVDRHMLRLLKMWLQAPVEIKDTTTGKRRMTGGKQHKLGTPQGGVISPLLANLYMNRMLKYWRSTDRPRRFSAEIVAYADDFVILSRDRARDALEWTRKVTSKLGLALNEEKTSLRNARVESFDFLGYTFGPHYFRKTGHWYLGASPSRKSVQRFKGKVTELLDVRNKSPRGEVLRRLNQLLIGWSGYFNYGTRLQAYRAVDHHVYDRVRHFFGKRHKVQTRATRVFSYEKVYGELGVVQLRRVHLGPKP